MASCGREARRSCGNGAERLRCSMEGETISVHISQADAQRVIELGGSIHVSEFLPRLRSNAVIKDGVLAAQQR
eukprot:scaffold24174_cov127-Isochrysis_galbana.AAC.8